MFKFNHFLYGFIPGLILPVLFMWVYLLRFYPNDLSFFATILELYPSAIFTKLLLLSAMPDMVIMFLFYKSDSFKTAVGMMVGGMPYLISSIFMM